MLAPDDYRHACQTSGNQCPPAEGGMGSVQMGDIDTMTPEDAGELHQLSNY